MGFDDFSRRLEDVCAQMVSRASELWDPESAKVLGYDLERTAYVVKTAYASLAQPDGTSPEWQKHGPALGWELIDHGEALTRVLRDAPTLYSFFLPYGWDVRLARDDVTSLLCKLMLEFEHMEDRKEATRRLLEVCSLLVVFCGLDTAALQERGFKTTKK